MAFNDDLAVFFSNVGLTLDASVAPSREALAEGLSKLNDFIVSLDSTTASALEEVTADFPTKGLLADPSVNVAPELVSVLRAFDAANANFSITTALQICENALEQIPIEQ